MRNYPTFRSLMIEYIGALDTYTDSKGVKHKSTSLCDISGHGVDGGYTLLTYTSDIRAVLDTYENEIERIVCEYATECGETLASMFAQYCKQKKIDGDVSEYATWLVWSAAEIIAHEVANAWDNDEAEAIAEYWPDKAEEVAA